MSTFAGNLKKNEKDHKRFLLYSTSWGKFKDGTDNIAIIGETDANGAIKNLVNSPTFFKGKDILFVASFYNNDVTMSQFHVISHLCESFAKSLTVLLPYYSTATMERVDINKDGVIPTASTLARLFNGLPSMGYPIRLMTYDLHTLQNRFFITGHAVASLHTATILMKNKIETMDAANRIDALVFPDAGAHKRFADLFHPVIKKEKTITCEKVRDGDKRIVTVIDGREILQDVKHVLIVDDILNSGGTLLECAAELRRINNKLKISVYTTHAVFSEDFFKRTANGDFNKPYIETLYVTNSIPNVITRQSRLRVERTDILIPRDLANQHDGLMINIDVLDLAPQVIKDL